eukprot:Opistho-2@83749
MECEFGVARFDKSVKILKGLRDAKKGSTAPTDWNNALAETVLAELAFDGGTLPDTCLMIIADTIWPRSAVPQDPNVYRTVFMITDGITNAQEAEGLRTVLPSAPHVLCVD